MGCEQQLLLSLLQEQLEEFGILTFTVFIGITPFQKLLFNENLIKLQ
jgi:hypothetical protein